MKKISYVLFLWAICCLSLSAQSFVTGVIKPYAFGSGTVDTATNFTIDSQGYFTVAVVSNPTTHLMTFTPPQGSPYTPFSVTVTAGTGTTNITQQIAPYVPQIGVQLGLVSASAVATNELGYAIPGTPASGLPEGGIYGQNIANNGTTGAWSNRITYSRSGLNNIGDSITAGTGTSLLLAYATLLQNKFGPGGNNFSVSGSQSEDMTGLQIYPNINPSRSENMPLTILCCTNDASVIGNTPGGTANAFHTMLSGAAWASIPYEYKIQGTNTASCTTTGTTASSTFGLTNGIALESTGASISCTTLVSGVAPLLVNWAAKDTYTSSASLSIDSGMITDTLNAFGYDGQQVGTSNNPNISAPFANSYQMTGMGAHNFTVTCTACSPSNPFIFLWAGSPMPSTPTNLGGFSQNPPAVYLGGTIIQSGNQNSAATAAYDTTMQSVANTLNADGAPVFFVNVRAFVDLDYATLDSDFAAATLPNGLTTTNSTNLPRHPNGNTSNGINVGGHPHLADAFLSVMPTPGLPVTSAQNFAPGTGVLSNTSVAGGYIPGAAPPLSQYAGLPFSATGARNSSFGIGALAWTTSGLENTCGGYESCYLGTTASSNTGFGAYALSANLINGSNSAFGAHSLGLSAGGSLNSAFGMQSMSALTAGTNNSCFGYNCLHHLTTKSSNVALGDGAGDNASDPLGPSQSIFIGHGATYSGSASLQNCIVLGYLMTCTASNQMILGTAATTVTTIYGAVNTPTGITGPAIEPTGACSPNGVWLFTQDGHGSFCAAGTWTQKF